MKNVAVSTDWVRERLSVRLSVWDCKFDRWLNVQSSVGKGTMRRADITSIQNLGVS